MPRIAAFLVVALLAALGSLVPVVARDQTSDGPALGAPVSYVGAEGAEIARLTVEELLDPFDAFDPGFPPEAGRRYVLLRLTVDNTGPRLLVFDANQVVLQDANGVLHDPGRVNRPAADAEVTPDLGARDIAPGEQVSGVIGYALPTEATPTRVYFQPDRQRLVPLASLAPNLAAPAAGDGTPVPYLDAEGRDAAQLAVTGVVLQWDDYESRLPPPPGHHYVVLSVTAANTGDQPFPLDPRSIALRSADGVVYLPVTIARGAEATTAEPDLPFGDIPPGEHVSGAVGYAVLNTASLAEVVYWPTRDRLVLLADLGGIAPIPATTNEAGPGVDTLADAPRPGVEGDSYMSPTYGYTVAWDGNVWRIAGEIVQRGYNGLRLDTEVTSVLIAGREAFRGDAAACIADATEERTGDPGVTDYSPAADRTAPTANGDVPSTAALSTYRFTDDLGGAIEVVEYVECRTLVENQAVLSITVRSSARYYDLDLPLVSALLAELRVPDPSTRLPVAATPNVEGAAANEAAGVTGHTYTSPTYGYSVIWGEAVWVPGAVTSEAGVDSLPLETEVSIVALEARDGFDGDAARCFANAVDELGNNPAVSDFAPAAERAAPTADGTVPVGGGVFAYRFTEENGAAFDRVAYLECRTLVEGRAVLEISYRSSARFYDIDRPSVATLLESIVLPAGTPTVTP